MVDPAPALDYAHVTQRLGASVGDEDGSDADLYPDFVPVTEGMITFTPTVALVKAATDSGPVTIVNAPIVVTIDPRGYLWRNAVRGVWLPDLGSTKVTPSIPRDQAAYVVTYSGLKYNDQSFKMAPIHINPVAGVELDLTNATPLPLPSGVTMDQLQAIATDALAAQQAAEAAAASVQRGVAGGVAGLNSSGLVTNADGSIPAALYDNVHLASAVITADGTTDDAPALNSLIDSVSASGGGVVRLPIGTIRLNTGIVPRNNVVIEGAGNLTVLRPLKRAVRGDWATPSVPLTNFHMRYLVIDGVDMTDTYKGYDAQYHLNCSWRDMTVRNTQMTAMGCDFLRQCVIQNVTVENAGLANDGTMPSGNGIGIGAGGWDDEESVLIIGCTVINAKRFGIMVEGSQYPVGVKIIGNYATACGDAGFGLGVGRGMIVEGNTSAFNVGNGFEFSSLTLPSACPAGEALLRGNHAHKNGGSGIVYDATVHTGDSGAVQIVGNMCSENTLYGINIDVDLSKVTHEKEITAFKIDGNTLVANVESGMRVATTGTGTWPLTAWTIDNNTSYRNASVGAPELQILANLKGSTIRNNMLYHDLTGAYRPGIGVGYTGVGSTGVAVTLTGCRIQGNTQANTGNKAVRVDPAVTLVGCLIDGNMPDDAPPTPYTYTTISTDTFDRADSATTLGSPWTTHGTGAWGILGNKAYRSSGGGNFDIAVQDATSANHSVATDVVVKSGGATIGAAVRVTDETDYLEVYVTTAVATLAKIAGTTRTPLVSVPQTLTDGATVRVRAETLGSVIKVYLDNVQVIAYTLTGADATTFASATKAGLYTQYPGTSSAYGSTFDNFALGKYAG